VVEAAFALKEVNDLSAVVESEKGFHVLKLTQRRPGFTRPFSEVKRQIQTRLFYEMRTKRMEAWVSEMRKKLNVEIFEDKLKQVKVDSTPPAPGAPGAPGSPHAAGTPPIMKTHP
jgi:peptidyl-prolyl cis-trans isomerase C